MFIAKSLGSFGVLGVGVLLSLTSTFVVSKLFGIESLGKFSVFVAYAAISSTVIKLGLSNLILREANRGIWEFKELYYYTLVILALMHFFVFASIYALSLLISNVDAFLLCLTIVSISLHDHAATFVRAFRSPNLAAIMENIVRPSLLIGVFFLVYLRDGASEDIILGLLFSYFLTFGVLFSLIFNILKIDRAAVSLYGFNAFFLRCFGDNFSLGLASAASQSYQNLFLILVEGVAGNIGAGFVRLALQIGSLINLSSAAINSLFSSKMAGLFFNGRACELWLLQKQCHMFMAVSSFCIWASLLAFYSPVFEYLGLASVPVEVVLIVSTAYLTQGLVGPSGNMLNMTSHHIINFICFFIADCVLLAMILLNSALEFTIDLIDVSSIFLLLFMVISIVQRFFMIRILGPNRI